MCHFVAHFLSDKVENRRRVYMNKRRKKGQKIEKCPHKEISPLPCMVGWGRCTTVGLESCARLALLAQSGAPNLYYKTKCLGWQEVITKIYVAVLRNFWKFCEELPGEESFSVKVSVILGKCGDTKGQVLTEYAIVACILAVVFVKCVGIFEKALFKYFNRIAQMFLAARFL